MKILFLLNHDGAIRNFEGALTALAERGHEIHFGVMRRRPAFMSSAGSLDGLCAAHPRMSWDTVPKGGRNTRLLGALCASRDYVRYLAPDYAESETMRVRARGYAPDSFVRVAESRALRGPYARAALLRALRALIEHAPTSPDIDEYMARRRPDVVLVTPLVGFGASQHAQLKSARAAGLPVALLVHSWDNLTNKGLIHELPDLVAVWNEAQAREAVDMHGVPTGRVVVTGAHSYDHWFDWSQARPREKFCARLGLDPARLFLLYVCSSSFIASDEARFVERWAKAVRVSDAPLRSAQLVVRPHPQNPQPWEHHGLDALGVTIWPPPGDIPLGTASRSDYFDSIHHCAGVVGINTSALVESAIQCKPVFAVLEPEYAGSQEGTLHFRHLAGSPTGGRAVTTARSLDEHVGQLTSALEPGGADLAPVEQFLRAFVRPHGLDEPCVPRLVQAVERFGGVSPPAPRRSQVAGAAMRRIAERVPASARARKPRAPAVRTDGPASGKRVLFFMWSINYDRLFEGALRALLERGHRVHVAFEVEKLGQSGDASLFERLRAEYPDLTYGSVPRANSPSVRLAGRLRVLIDLLRYYEPAMAGAVSAKARVESRASGLGLTFLRPFLASNDSRRRVDRVLRRLESALPADRGGHRLIEQIRPDLVLITPLVGLGSPQDDYVRSAAALGIPSSVVVASWDNLTNKGIIRTPPDLTVVWNKAQIREAVELHGIPADRVVATGAHSYDHWFEWAPRTSHAEFCERVGLDPDRPFLLYTCSSLFIAPDEALFVERWLRELRRADDPLLREASVLIRPHPANADMWRNVDFREAGRTAIWPRAGAKPTSDDSKAEYYDSIHHSSCVVGINTSALVESAILGRPVCTVLDPELESAQAGMLHFAHLAGSGGDGLLSVAQDFDQHREQLAVALRAPEAMSERSASFARSFLRPRGLDVAARDVLIEELEGLMERGAVARSSERRGDRLLRAAVQPAALAVTAADAARPVLRAARRLAAPLASAGPRTRHLAHERSEARRHAPEPQVRRGQPLRLLFVIDHPGMLMHFDETIAMLIERGHRVDLAFARPEKYPVGLDAIPIGSPRLAIHDAPPRSDRYTGLVRRIRRLADYAHYLDPSLTEARYARAKWRALAEFPHGLRWLARRETLPRARVRRLLGLLADAERAVPTDPRIDRFIQRREPDVVIVTPLVDARTDLTDYVRSARALGIPSALCVASWDNLSSKGLVRGQPDRLTVWNETQRWEAGEYHGIAGERVVVTGSQPHDRWFHRRPATTPEAFLAQFGLPPDEPFVLFVGSTQQGQRPDAEVEFVREWVRALRGSDDPVLRLSVLVRPHPTNARGWAEADVSELERLAVWMRDQPLPIRADERSQYYDSLHHAAAIVGINSSAMIEAAIIGRPVHTVAMPEWRPMQRDLLHFRYLLPENGGFLREARDLEHHLELLAGDLADPLRWQARQRDFVRRFLRPAGLDRAAAPILAEAIESFAGVEPMPPSRLSPALFALSTGTRASVVGLRAYIAANRMGMGLARRASNVLAARATVSPAADGQPGLERWAKAVRRHEGEFQKRLARVGATDRAKPLDLEAWLAGFRRNGVSPAPAVTAEIGGNGRPATSQSPETVQ